VSAGTYPVLLATGFGPFPGAPENPTSALIEALINGPPETFGASAFHAVVLPTDYLNSWEKLRRLYRKFEPDVVVHFGLSNRAKAITVETVARRACDPTKPDAAGYVPPSGQVVRRGAETLPVTLPVKKIVAALTKAGFLAITSQDAGGYVCNATLYRSLAAAPPGRRVGLVHVTSKEVLPEPGLLEAAAIILHTAVSVGRRIYGSNSTEKTAL
jgi:pyroglutamyl-peptidase